VRTPTALLIPCLVAATSCAPTEGLLPPTEGVLDVLTYNVAGLPQGVSGSDPERNIPLIGPLLNEHDLVLVQEDFEYPAELRADVTLPYQSWPKESDNPVGDGLNRFSRHFFAPQLHREQWRSCNGLFDSASDCLSEKGLSMAPLVLGPGVGIDVYNLHMDAGGDENDFAARSDNVDQLLEAMEARSGENPILIAGDTNLGFGRDVDNEGLLDSLLERGGLRDACFELDCDEPGRIDRVFVRDGAGMALSFDSWSVDERYVDGEGEPLSDHLAVRVGLSWQRLAE
jgi:hypothetical protein